MHPLTLDIADRYISFPMNIILILLKKINKQIFFKSKSSKRKYGSNGLARKSLTYDIVYRYKHIHHTYIDKNLKKKQENLISKGFQ